MITRKSQVSGLKELDKLLQKLPTNIQKKYVRKALRAGSRPIIQKARSMAPVDTGALRRSIRFSPRRDPTRAAIGFAKQVSLGKKLGGGKRNPAKYAHLIEFGSSRTRAQPFMRPALDAAGDDSIKAIANVLRAELEKETLRLRKR